MATFTYIAADRSGTTRRGTISAANTHEAAEAIRDEDAIEHAFDPKELQRLLGRT